MAPERVMAYFESITVERVSPDGRRITARAILEDGDDPLRVSEGLRCWIDDELVRWGSKERPLATPKGVKL